MSGGADRYVTESPALLQVVPQFALDHVLDAIRDTTATATATAETGRLLGYASQLRRHAAANRVTEIVLTRLAKQLHMAAVRILRHKGLLGFMDRSPGGHGHGRGLTLWLRMVHKRLVVGMGVSAPVPNIFSVLLVQVWHSSVESASDVLQRCNSFVLADKDTPALRQSAF